MSDAQLTDLFRHCRSCGFSFVISIDEQRFLQRLFTAPGQLLILPRHCQPCRQERRRMWTAAVDNGELETLTCVDCGASFVFGDRDKRFYASQGFARPRRCRDCRHVRRAGRGELHERGIAHGGHQ